MEQYHLYLDNYFTSPDLLVHLKKIGLKATGNLRKNRIKVKHKIDKKSQRGSYLVHKKKNSGMNFISVLYSKRFSILSTAAGVTPMMPVKKYSHEAKDKLPVEFPLAV